MRVYNEKQLTKVFCNRCGKELAVENGILKEGCYHGKQRFDYFSEKDGVIHEFELCEACYDMLIESFRLPVSQREETEFV
ncbi:MAG: hypothetical protein IJZ44_07845 [Lachnospiraceae bacterium]|nr:hypothetical protein [Lachnospiraceae bacterium]